MYLFIYYTRTYSRNRGVGASTPRKETRRKDEGGERRNVKGSRHKGRNHLHPTRAIEALIGDKEQKENQEMKKKEKGCGVASFYPQGSYGEPILLTSRPTGGTKWTTSLRVLGAVQFFSS